MKSVRKRKWCFYPQFSLRLLIALMFAVALGVGIYAARHREHELRASRLRQHQVNLIAASTFEGFGDMVEVQDQTTHAERSLKLGSLPRPGEEVVEIRCGNFRRLQDCKPIESNLLDEQELLISLIRPALPHLVPQGDDLGILAKLPQLKRLCLSQARIPSDKLAAAVGKLQTLEYLGLNDVGLQDDDLRHFAQLKHLRYLSLGGNAVTTAGIRQLGTLDELRVLELGSTALDGHIADELYRFPNLTHLYLDRTAIRSLTLKPPLKLEYLLVRADLREFHILPGCRVKSLSLSVAQPLLSMSNSSVEASELTEECVPQIDPDCGLRRLEVVSTPFTLRGIAAAGLGRHLETLVLSSRALDERTLGPSRFPHLKTIIAIDYDQATMLEEVKVKTIDQVTIRTMHPWYYRFEKQP